MRSDIDNVIKKGSRRLLTDFIVVLRLPVTLTGGQYSEYFYTFFVLNLVDCATGTLNLVTLK
jgi:hypothetical protein